MGGQRCHEIVTRSRVEAHVESEEDNQDGEGGEGPSRQALRVSARMGGVARGPSRIRTRTLARVRQEGQRVALRLARGGAGGGPVLWLDRRPDGIRRRSAIPAAIYPATGTKQMVADQLCGGRAAARVRPGGTGRGPRDGGRQARWPLGGRVRIAAEHDGAGRPPGAVGRATLARAASSSSWTAGTGMPSSIGCRMPRRPTPGSADSRSSWACSEAGETLH